MYNKQLCMRLLYFVVIRLYIGNLTVAWAEVAHFKLACFGNLAFKGYQSRNVIWQWSHDTHLDINKHNNPVIARWVLGVRLRLQMSVLVLTHSTNRARWVQNKERENTIRFFIDLFDVN